MQIQELGLMTNLDLIENLVTLSGLTVADIGCGDMTFSKLMVESGAKVLACDPDPIQAAINHKNPVPGIDFFESGGENLPFSDGLMDGVFFAYSLHHIPGTLLSQVFDEVRRVLRPGGFVLVIEPTHCPLNEVMRKFHDEEAERAIAWSALQEFANRFQSRQEIRYFGEITYESWNSFAENFASRTYNSGYTAEDVWDVRVREAFENLGGPGHVWKTNKRAMLLTGKLCS